METQEYDLVIVGAGPVGCVVADRAARELGWRCLVLEKRDHVAGNCYDFFHESGLLLHKYGPHCFRTGNKALLDYLSEFTEWLPGNHRVQVYSRDSYYQFPINLTTLEQFFGCPLTEESARALMEQKRIPISAPENSEEYVLSRVGKELYEAFYLGYTLKQWGLHPRDLAPSVCGRIPVRFNRDDRYVDEPFQLMPKDGYTALFTRMLRHPLIQVRLGCDYLSAREMFRPKRALVYTGPVDAYFDYCSGRLPWRSLDFEWLKLDQEYRQQCVAINYPSDHAYTRSVEIKHVTGQKHPQTIIALEYPCAEGDPYYPVPAEGSSRKYDVYRKLAEQETIEKNVFFCGRLATYRYLDMDKAIESALQLITEIKHRSIHAGPLGSCTRL